MDFNSRPRDHPGMPRPRHLTQHQRLDARPKLYIGEWIRALGLKPRDVARDAEINEGYLSMLISRKRDNPSLDILTRIADAMGVGIDDLRRPPPDKKVLEEISRLSPEQLDRLRRSKQP